ncbi:pentapeptide repeat-containing protein [Streptomyces avermitilis]|uniref:pentapeptide repeat-containing protein n=1 Tax=Streptomyces avermitilis TaxID=33903 RepID=UPI003830F4EB
MPAANSGTADQENRWWTRLEKSVGLLVSMATLAVAAFAWMSIKQVNSEQNITREGQITDRYNAAVENLGNSSQDVRLGGIYALQRIMEDSPRDQPTVIDVLSAYVRAHTSKAPSVTADASLDRPDGPANDVAAALSVLRDRESRNNGSGHVDLSGRDLRGADLRGAHLHGADLHRADFHDTDLRGVDLHDADLHGANLWSANLSGSKLDGHLRGVDLHDAILNMADLSNTDLVGLNLHGAKLGSANLSDSFLLRTDLSGAMLRGANLNNVNMTNATLVSADLLGTVLAGVDLTGADLTHADLRSATLNATDGQDDTTVSIQQLLSAHLDKDTGLPAKLANDTRIRKAIESPSGG